MSFAGSLSDIRQFADALVNGVAVLDEQGRVVIWNRWLVAATGIGQEDAAGRFLPDIFPGIARSRLSEAVTFAIERQMPSLLSPALHGTLLALYRNADDRRQGVRMRHMIHVIPLTGLPGAACMLQITDMTAAIAREQRLRTQAEELRLSNQELAQSRQRLASVLGAAPFAILIVGKSGDIELCNESAEATLGYPAAELCGRNVEILVPLAARAGHAAHVANYHAAPVARQMGGGRRISALRKDGSEFIAEIGLTPISIDGQQKTLVTVIDITRRAQNEDELERYRYSLERMVAERTAEAEAARRVAEQASEAKSRLLANVSHELKTPLHAVVSFAHLGEERCQADTAIPPRIGQYFSRISGAATRLEELIHSLLDLSGLDAGSAVFSLKPCALAPVVAGALAALSDEAARRQIRLVADDFPPELAAQCDGPRIREVLRRIVDNALQFSPAGSQVSISGQLVAAWNEVEITVADRGVGIPEDELESVFEAFVQSSRTRTSAGGKGMGLAICRHIVRGHGGRIWVENRTGGGCELHFTLPLGNAEATA